MRFRFFGVNVELLFLSVAAISFILILDKSGKALACIMSALIHEFGHIFSMLLFKNKPKGIRFRVFDILIEANESKSFIEDLVVTLSGPMFNFIFAMLSCNFSKNMAVASFVLGVFNLLPVDTFDGGHAMKITLSRNFSDNTTSTIMKTLTFLILIPIFLLGLLVLFYSKYN